MALELHAHPFSSYCQKALIALYENDTPFEFRLLAPEEPAITAAFAGLWPIRRFPLLVDEGRAVMEASIIIEHLSIHHPGPVRLLPEDPAAALAPDWRSLGPRPGLSQPPARAPVVRPRGE